MLRGMGVNNNTSAQFVVGQMSPMFIVTCRPASHTLGGVGWVIAQRHPVRLMSPVHNPRQYCITHHNTHLHRRLPYH